MLLRQYRFVVFYFLKGAVPTKIAVIVSGLSYDSQRRFVEGLLESAEPDGTDLFFLVCDVEDYQSRTVYETGAFNIYSLPDFSLFDAIIGYFDTIHDVDVVSDIIDRIRRSGKPCVSINTYVEDFICLKLDNQTGLRDILDHLYEEHKVRSIYYISGAPDNTDATERLQTVRTFLRGRNITFTKDSIYYGNYTYPSGYKGMDALIRSGRPLPDAVVCANDKMAIGAISRCREEGIRIPEDLIITGYDDSELARIHQPGITTVRRSEVYSGSLAYQLARDAVISGTHPHPQNLYGEAVFSASCGCSEPSAMNVSDLRDQLMSQLFTTETETYLIKTLLAEITSLNSYEDFLSIFRSYACKLSLGDIYISLCGNQEQYQREIENTTNGIGAGRDVTRFTGTSTLALAYRNGEFLNPSVFHTADIIPPDYLESDRQNFFFVYPLHHREHCFGFIAFGNKKEVCNTQTMNLFALAVSSSLEYILEHDRMNSLMNKLDNLRLEDPLTRVFNRAGVSAHWPDLIRKATEENLFPAAIFMDMDDLKSVNDRYTHEEGDKYITAVADVIRQCCGPDDLLVRFGGDEFVVFTAVSSVKSIEEQISCIRKAMDDYNQKHPCGYVRSISIGHYICDDTRNADPDIMISRADSDMYYEKRGKKSRRGTR